MIAAQPLDRHDPPLLQQADGGGDRVLTRQRPAGAVEQRQARPALRAGDGLGMEAAAGRVLVFRPAGGAHGKVGHGGVRAVVGDGGDDGVARPAVGAVDERIAVAAVGGVEELAQTIGADPGIGGDLRLLLPFPVAGADGESRLPLRRQLRRLQAGDGGKGRQFVMQGAQEGGERRPLPFRLDGHPPAVVAHPAADPQPAGELKDEGTETNPLDDAFNVDFQARQTATSERASFGRNRRLPF